MVAVNRSVEERREVWLKRLDSHVIEPSAGPTTLGFKIWIGILLGVMGLGSVALSIQLRDGLVVTGMRDRISWGVYIAAFVFFAGISMSGTLISAILRATKASWHAPVTRIAEAVTVIGLLTAGLFVIVDMGRPDRLHQMYVNGSWQSPLMWDMMAITIYLTASSVYLLVPMIPDLAFFRDRLGGEVSPLRAWLYDLFSFGWEDAPGQRRAITRATRILMITVIPVAVSVHTVLAMVFSTTTRVSWHSTVYGFFFVIGAIFSGIAMLIIVFAVVRRRFHLEEYVTEVHFQHLGQLLAAVGAVMIYTNVTEVIIAGYPGGEDELSAFQELFYGRFAPLYWFYFVGGLVVPVLIVAFRRTRTIAGLVVASTLVVVAMFIERYFIVIAGLRVPLMPYEPRSYAPTWIEWSILAGGCAFFLLLLTLFTRFLPVLARWEMREEHEQSEEQIDAPDDEVSA